MRENTLIIQDKIRLRTRWSVVVRTDKTQQSRRLSYDLGDLIK
jgi:hypothetical protein